MRRLAFLIVFLVPALAAAEERITLREALERAVKGNPTLASKNLDVTIADADLLAARGVDDFTINATANVNFERTDPTIAMASGRAPQIDQYDFSLGVSKNVPTGGRASLDFGGGMVHIPTGADAVDVYFSSVTAAIFQPILRGFGANNTQRAPLRRARAQRTVEELDRANVASSVVQAVVQAYWEIAYARRNLEIARASLGLATEQLRITRARLDVGVGAPTDIAAVEQTIALREETVLLAEVAISETSLALRQLVGLPITPTQIDLIADDKPELAPTDLPLDKAIDRAYENNPQLATVRARGEQAKIEVEVTENGLLPQLDFNASASLQGNDLKVGGVLSQLGKLDVYTIQAGLVFSMPIGNRSARGARDAAQAQYRKVLVSQADIKSQIGVATTRAVNAVVSARKRMQVLETATRAAQVNLDAERARFDVGRSTNFDVLLRQDEMANAQLRQARAQVDYLKAVAVLQTLTGDILPSYNMQVGKR